jgi:hypothetical protein
MRGAETSYIGVSEGRLLRRLGEPLYGRRYGRVRTLNDLASFWCETASAGTAGSRGAFRCDAPDTAPISRGRKLGRGRAGGDLVGSRGSG